MLEDRVSRSFFDGSLRMIWIGIATPSDIAMIIKRVVTPLYTVSESVSA
jgi:hypothetical protein